MVMQLSITKAGTKLTPFLIFKGEYLLIDLFVLLEILQSNNMTVCSYLMHQELLLSLAKMWQQGINHL